MEAEEVLLLIMKKLKEYKANPKQSTVQEKARQKYLMKMFCIYTSLKRKERAKQRQKDKSIYAEKHIVCKKLTEDTNGSVLKQKTLLINSNVTGGFNDNEYGIDSLNSNNSRCKSIYNSTINPEKVFGITNDNRDLCSVESNSKICKDCNINNEFNIESQINNGYSKQCNNASNEDLPVYPNKIEYDKKDVQKSVGAYDDNKILPFDDFLKHLGNGLRKLPYRQRSKLEIEFLARLYEVEESLNWL